MNRLGAFWTAPAERSGDGAFAHAAISRLTVGVARSTATPFSLTPARSRWERENRGRSHRNTERSVYQTTIESVQAMRLLFPLPAGEGKGEGERCGLTLGAQTYIKSHSASLRRHLLICAIASLLPLLSIAASSGKETNTAPAAVWDTSVRATSGFGYRDNVLRSGLSTESSAFFNASADASFLRLAESGAYLSFFLLGDDTRYFDAPSVNYEQFFSADAQAVTPVGTSDELGSQFNYLYQHQVLDVSETEGVQARMLVDGHSYALRSHWKHTLRPGWAVQLEAAGLRQLYDGDLSDYWEAGGRWSLIRTYGHRSELSLGYQFKSLLYDSREEYTSDGAAIPGTSLIYWQNELGAQWRHHWDQARHWRTTSKFSYLFNRDNGAGYFDYDRVLFSQQLRWAAGGWEIKANARCGWYFYPVQQIGNEDLERSYVALDFRVERRLGKHWLLYAVGEREWNASNDSLDQYNDWMAGGGLGVEF
jgi:hypothetical protein